MTKFYRSQGRHRSRRGLYIITASVLLISLIAVGTYFVLQKKSDKQQNKTEIIQTDATKYVSFGGAYLFSVPAKYTVDETLISGVVIVYPEESPPKAGMSLDQLYKAGAIAVQPILELKDDDPKAFKEYVTNKLAQEFKKSTTKSTIDVREAKQGDTEALKVFALAKDGKRLKAGYAINYTKPLLMIAADETNALKIVGSTMQELKDGKVKSDIDEAAKATKAILEMIIQHNLSGLTGKSMSGLDQKTVAAEVEASGPLLDRSVSILGGSYNGEVFAAQISFEPKTKDQVAAGGVVSLRKDSGAWKLDALQLPKP